MSDFHSSLQLKFMNRNGTGAIILAPTRELAMQTYGVLKELMVNHIQTHGLIMGGSDRRAEAKRLINGVNIGTVFYCSNALTKNLPKESHIRFRTN